MELYIYIYTTAWHRKFMGRNLLLYYEYNFEQTFFYPTLSLPRTQLLTLKFYIHYNCQKLIIEGQSFNGAGYITLSTLKIDGIFSMLRLNYSIGRIKLLCLYFECFTTTEI